MKGMLGKKIGMTTVFDDSGNKIPVTMLEVGPCPVVRKKTSEKDGYDAFVIGFGDVREKVISKPEKGVFDKAKVTCKKFLREFEFDTETELKVGDEIKVDIFSEGEWVVISGRSKGKGFQGTIKRHGFSGAQKTHGQSDRMRAPGSIGNSSWPSRVWKGMKMAGNRQF